MAVRRPLAAALVLTAAAGAGYWLWETYSRGEDAVIRDRLNAFAAETNEAASGSLGLAARAARIGSFFTDDVVIDLGDGSVPIRGKDTVIGMAARLEPRTTAFAIAFDDVTVSPTEGGAAEVSLTATVRHNETGTSEASVDAREFNLGMRKIDGEWLIARVTAVEALNKGNPLPGVKQGAQ